MKLLDKVAIVALGAVVITNPASGQFILEGLDWLFQQIFFYGSPINFVASAVLFGYVISKIYTSRDKVNVPPKTAKTKMQNYID